MPAQRPPSVSTWFTHEERAFMHELIKDFLLGTISPGQAAIAEQLQKKLSENAELTQILRDIPPPA